MLTFSREAISANANIFDPILGIEATNNQARNMTEFNLMLPVSQNSDSLYIIDLKLKADNQKSLEGNLGLVYRYNFDDKAIFGIYGYYDRRKTMVNFCTNQATFGMEILSHYFDTRFNIYIPEKKEKILTPANTEFKRNGTKVYAIANQKIIERAAPGYDVEIGTPLFGLFSSLDEKLETRIYLSHYKFSQKGLPENKGIKLRFEQKLFENHLSPRGLELTLNFGTNFINYKKRSDFASLSIRKSLTRGPVIEKISKFKRRMMSPVIRDVDIVTQDTKNTPRSMPVFWNGRAVNNLYFVGQSKNADYSGDGTYEKPFSADQLEELIVDKKLVLNEGDFLIPINIDKPIDDSIYNNLVLQFGAVDIKRCSLNFTTIDNAQINMLDASVLFPDFKNRFIANHADQKAVIADDFNAIINSSVNSIVEAIKELPTHNTDPSTTGVNTETQPPPNKDPTAAPTIIEILSQQSKNSITNVAENILQNIQKHGTTATSVPLSQNLHLSTISPTLQQAIAAPMSEVADDILLAIQNNTLSTPIVPLQSSPSFTKVSPALQQAINSNLSDVLDQILYNLGIH